jgi:hypothetical protein
MNKKTKVNMKSSVKPSVIKVGAKILGRDRRNVVRQKKLAESRIISSKQIEANKKRVEALKPFQWQPGQSGNPAGMPKGTVHFHVALRRLGEETGCFASEMKTIRKYFPNFPKDASVEQMMAAMIQIIAMKKGYPWAYDRCFGKVAQQIDFNQKGEAVSNVKIDITKLTPEQVEALRGIIRVSTNATDDGDTSGS